MYTLAPESRGPVTFSCLVILVVLQNGNPFREMVQAKGALDDQNDVREAIGCVKSMYAGRGKQPRMRKEENEERGERRKRGKEDDYMKRKRVRCSPSLPLPLASLIKKATAEVSWM